MKILNSLAVLIFLTALNSCSINHDNEGDTNIKVETGSKNDFPKKAGITCYLDSASNVMVFTFIMEKPENISFPVDAKEKDTLKYTCLKLECLYEGKPVQLNEAARTYFNQRKAFWQNDDSLFLKLRSDTVNFNTRQTIVLSLPYYALSGVPAGQQKKLQFHISQQYFFSDTHNKMVQLKNEEKRNGNTQDSAIVFYRNAIKQTQLDIMVNFSINMPAVYSSEMICSKIELQNDSLWSPAGSDVTLFKSSYPDLFYQAYLPEGFLQHESKKQTSTAVWDIGDTTKLYFYTEDDLIKFYVMDYDNLSRDDIVSKNETTVNTIRRSGLLSFEHVKKMYVRLGPPKKIN